MQPDKLMKSDKATLILEALKDGKIRVSAAAFEDARVILPDQVLEVRNVHGQLIVLRKKREAEPTVDPAAPTDPYTGEPLKP